MCVLTESGFCPVDAVWAKPEALKKIRAKAAIRIFFILNFFVKSRLDLLITKGALRVKILLTLRVLIPESVNRQFESLEAENI